MLKGALQRHSRGGHLCAQLLEEGAVSAHAVHDQGAAQLGREGELRLECMQLRARGRQGALSCGSGAVDQGLWKEAPQAP